MTASCKFLENGNNIGVIYTDFAKAFYKVDFMVTLWNSLA